MYRHYGEHSDEDNIAKKVCLAEIAAFYMTRSVGLLACWSKSHGSHKIGTETPGLAGEHQSDNNINANKNFK
jgi:hypothetical protein